MLMVRRSLKRSSITIMMNIISTRETLESSSKSSRYELMAEKETLSKKRQQSLQLSQHHQMSNSNQVRHMSTCPSQKEQQQCKVGVQLLDQGLPNQDNFVMKQSQQQLSQNLRVVLQNAGAQHIQSSDVNPDPISKREEVQIRLLRQPSLHSQ